MRKFTFLLAGAFFMSLSVFGQENQESGVVYCESFNITRPLIEINKENPVNMKKIEREHRQKVKESKDRKFRKPNDYPFTFEKNGFDFGTDSTVIQRIDGSRKGSGTKLNTLGLTASGFRPMDPSGAAGSNNYYIQAINSTTYRIINKLTGATITTGSVGSLWSPATPNDGDPIIMYDRYADRWFISQFGVSGNKIYIAVSATNDPTGSYYTYSFTSPQFPDYLKFSIWQDGYYMTSNQSNQKVFAFERTAMLAGNPNARAVYTSYNPPDGGGFFCPLPGDADGNGGLPPAGTPCPIFSYSDNGWGGGNTDAIQIYQMTVNWTPTTPTATVTFLSAVPTAAFDGSYNASWNDISQPGTTQKLDGIGGVLNYRAQWRKWPTYNSVVLTWGVKLSASQRSVMWCELRQTGNTWSMYQQGVFTPDAYSRWVGSIAMDDNGNIGLCYAISAASTMFPSLGYTGRLASDPLGTMTFAETIAVAGTVSQSTSWGNRFGDYSHTSLDPNGTEFFHTGEYMGGNSNSPARTRIYSFQLAQATDANVSIVSNDADNIICSGNSITFTATPTNGGSTPSYQWQVNGVNAGTNSTTFTPTNLTNGSVVTCIMTSNLQGVTANPATSNSVTVTVLEAVAPTVSINGPNTICSGNSAVFTTSATNSGSGASYQWQVNGVNAGSNASSFSSSTLPNGAAITVTMTSTANCANPTTVTSSPFNVTVNPTPPTPTITNNGGVLTSSAATGNQWYLNGTIIPGATGQTYTPTANGVYTVKVTLNNCASPISPAVTIAGLGIDELTGGTFNMYPNPSTGQFTLQFSAKVDEEYNLVIYDAVGKLVHSESWNNINGDFSKLINLGKVSTGMYNVVLKGKTSEVNRKLIIK
jgi:hypothetical protein